MKTKYMIDGSTVDIFKLNEETALDKLPPKVYSIRFHELRGYYLEILKDKLEIPKKIYGNVEERANKCLKTYIDRTSSTGILLTGDKGTGKTLLVSLLANKVIDKLNLPVILIKEAFTGSQFFSFIENIGECCLIFDEFGKMYKAREDGEDMPSQQSLLSLMDGVDKTKRLIIITENREQDINEFILNRPSRAYYHFRYQKLDEDSIKDYCKDHNIRDDVVSDIIDLCRRSRIFSFDMLQSIVEEHLRFNSKIEEIIKELNIDIFEDIRPKLEIVKVIENISNEEREICSSKIIDKPVGYYYSYIKLKKQGSKMLSKQRKINEIVEINDDESKYDSFEISENNLVFASNGKEIYKTSNFTVITKVLEQKRFDYSMLF